MAAAVALCAGVMLFAYLDPGRIAKKLGSVAYVNRLGRIGPVTAKAWRSMGFACGATIPCWVWAWEILRPLTHAIRVFPPTMWIDHAHNDYVEAVAETGLVGALLILSALALFLRLAFRDWGHPFRSQAGWIRLGAAIGCCGLLLHSLLDFNLHIPANAAWFAALAGIATTARGSEATQDQRPE